MHPADDIRGIKSNILSNKTIILGITGSIACVEDVKLARELIRHGANVIPVMTSAATRLISPDALYFATAPIVGNLTGGAKSYIHGSVVGSRPATIISLITNPIIVGYLSNKLGSGSEHQLDIYMI